MTDARARRRPPLLRWATDGVVYNMNETVYFAQDGTVRRLQDFSALGKPYYRPAVIDTGEELVEELMSIVEFYSDIEMWSSSQHRSDSLEKIRAALGLDD